MGDTIALSLLGGVVMGGAYVLGRLLVQAARGSDPRMAGATPDVGTPSWSPVTVAGYQIQTTTEPLNNGQRRPPMSFSSLLALAKVNRALPITPAVSDARWAQAVSKTPIAPLNDPTGALYNDAGQIQRFADRLGPVGSVLRDGGWKEMVLGQQIVPSGPGSMLFYGGRLNASGALLQKGIKSDHDDAWIEYDQLGSLMSRDAIAPDGSTVDLLDVLAQGGSPLMAGKLPPHLVDALR